MGNLENQEEPMQPEAKPEAKPETESEEGELPTGQHTHANQTGVQGKKGETGETGLTGEKGPPGDPGGNPGGDRRREQDRREGPRVVTTAELMTAIRLAAAFGVAGLFAVGIALTIFVVSASNEREDICDVIRNVTLGQAQALVTATERDPDMPPPTPEEAERRKEVVDTYLEGVNKSLEGC